MGGVVARFQRQNVKMLKIGISQTGSEFSKLRISYCVGNIFRKRTQIILGLGEVNKTSFAGE